MKKQILLSSLVLSMMAVSALGLTKTFARASARNCEETSITDATVWDDGTLKGIKVNFDWGVASDEYLYVAIFDEHQEPGEYWYTYDESNEDINTSIDVGIELFVETMKNEYKSYINPSYADTFQCYAHSNDPFTPTGEGKQYFSINVEFEKGKVPLDIDKTYSFVMFNAPSMQNYRPTDPLGKLVCEDGKLSFENSTSTPTAIDIKCEHDSLTKINGVAPNETEAGYKDYYECSCGKYFEDEDATIEITNLDSWKAEGGNGYLAPLGNGNINEPENEPNKKGLTPGAICGIVIGSIFLFLIIVFIVLYILWRHYDFKVPVIEKVLTPAFRWINNLLFKTKLNKVELKEEKEKAGEQPEEDK